MTGALINIDVDDLQRAESFYCSVFDLKIKRRFGQDGVELDGLGVPLFLLKKGRGTTAFPQGEQTRDYHRHWTPVHLDFTVQDIVEVHRRAVEAGARAESTIREAPYGKIVLMSDPFGHGLCLIEFNEQGYDAVVS